MLAQEDDVEISALAKRGWTIARRTGRDRKTVCRNLAGLETIRAKAEGPLEPWQAYLEARFSGDPHVFATVLFSELAEIGLYPFPPDPGQGDPPGSV